ncbi:MAG: signal peptidase I [Parcubacteria group bacterium]
MNTEKNSDSNLSQTENSKKSQFKEIGKEILIFVAIALGIVLPFRMYVAEPYLVDGISMDPTFTTGDYLIVNKFSYIKGAPERNSVVVFKYPYDNSPKSILERILNKPSSPKRNFIKRIIGLPGETVIIKNNNVTIINKENPNGFELDQSYITHVSDGEYTRTLSPDEYFVMGDNRQNSYDSRGWGALNKKYILGKPILRLWPINEIGLFPGSIDKK